MDIQGTSIDTISSEEESTCDACQQKVLLHDLNHHVCQAEQELPYQICGLKPEEKDREKHKKINTAKSRPGEHRINPREKPPRDLSKGNTRTRQCPDCGIYVRLCDMDSHKKNHCDRNKSSKSKDQYVSHEQKGKSLDKVSSDTKALKKYQAEDSRGKQRQLEEIPDSTYEELDLGKLRKALKQNEPERREGRRYDKYGDELIFLLQSVSKKGSYTTHKRDSLVYSLQVFEKVRIKLSEDYYSLTSKSASYADTRPYFEEEGCVYQINTPFVSTHYTLVMFLDGFRYRVPTAFVHKVSDTVETLPRTRLQKSLSYTCHQVVELRPGITSADLHKYRPPGRPWQPWMKEVIDFRGYITGQPTTKDYFYVDFLLGSSFSLHKSALQKVDNSQDKLKRGDLVLITHDLDFAIKTQDGSGGWIPKMANSLANLAIVQDKVPGGIGRKFRVSMKTNKALSYIWNEQCLTRLWRKDQLMHTKPY